MLLEEVMPIVLCASILIFTRFFSLLIQHDALSYGDAYLQCFSGFAFIFGFLQTGYFLVCIARVTACLITEMFYGMFFPKIWYKAIFYFIDVISMNHHDRRIAATLMGITQFWAYAFAIGGWCCCRASMSTRVSCGVWKFCKCRFKCNIHRNE